MPEHLLLHEFGSQVWHAFGAPPYHVGSSLMNKTWRDVDVRLMLSDEDYAAWGLGNPRYPHKNGKWVALCLAFSALGRQMTSLPIDFQIQQQSQANTEYDKSHLRSALGVVALRMAKDFGSPSTTQSEEATSQIIDTRRDMVRHQ